MGDDGVGDGGINVIEENPYLPDLRPGPSIPHYYGDYVRQLFMMCSGIILACAPFVANTLPGILPFEIGAAILFVILGALTNPQNKLGMLANAVAAFFGVLAYELLALTALGDGHNLTFIQRELLTLFFLFALYFSVKTLRNMTLHLIGKKGGRGEVLDGSE